MRLSIAIGLATILALAGSEVSANRDYGTTPTASQQRSGQPQAGGWRDGRGEPQQAPREMVRLPARFQQAHTVRKPKLKKFRRSKRHRPTRHAFKVVISRNLLASLWTHGGGEHHINTTIQRAQTRSKRRARCRRTMLRRRIQEAGFSDGEVGSPLTPKSYVRMGAVDEFFRKLDAMIMGGRLTHNDLRIENVRVSTDGTLWLVNWKLARPGGDSTHDVIGQKRLRVQIDKVLYDN